MSESILCKKRRPLVNPISGILIESPKNIDYFREPCIDVCLNSVKLFSDEGTGGTVENASSARSVPSTDSRSFVLSCIEFISRK